MFTKLPLATTDIVTSHLARVSEQQFKDTRWRHQQKLARWLETKHSKPQNNEVDLLGTQLKRWVVNLSKYKLTESERSVLAKGLNFAPTPTRTPVDEFVVATELACRAISNEKADTLRAQVASILKSSKPPKSNIAKQERLALGKLRKEPSILILPADKGRSTVILDKDKYASDVKHMLSDECTYKVLPADPTQKYKKKLIALLKRLKEDKKITESQYRYLYPTSEITPRLY